MEALPSILIIDNETRSLESLKHILDDRFDVHTAENTDAAKEVLQQQWIRSLSLIMACRVNRASSFVSRYEKIILILFVSLFLHIPILQTLSMPSIKWVWDGIPR